MFLESTCGIIALLAVAERALTASDRSREAAQAQPGTHAASRYAHPHARTVRLQRHRRPGMVAPRPAHCLSPIGAVRATAAG
ncbi:MAG: hypothetical protein ACYCXW_03515 [Solirubrobacteraceae bacterium]